MCENETDKGVCAQNMVLEINRERLELLLSSMQYALFLVAKNYQKRFGFIEKIVELKYKLRYSIKVKELFDGSRELSHYCVNESGVDDNNQLMRKVIEVFQAMENNRIFDCQSAAYSFRHLMEHFRIIENHIEELQQLIKELEDVIE